VRRGLIVFAGLASVAVACLGPTQVDVRLSTDLAPRPRVRVAVFAGAPPLVEGQGDAVAEIEWTGASEIGSLTLVPKGDRSAPLAVRVVMTTNGRDPRECTDKDAAGCIISRRALAFVPHTSLSLPIRLSERCLGVPCSPDTTCALGTCVSSTVACDAGSCVLPAEQGTPVDAGAPDAFAPDAEVEAGVDASVPPELANLAAGSAHTCLVRSGKLRCWGDNRSGQLGLDDTKSRGDEPNVIATLPPVDLRGGTPRGLGLGRAHTCVAMTDGKVKCWGDNSQGQLGLGDRVNRGDTAGSMASLPAVDLVTPVAQVVAGRDHTCVLFIDGRVKCWGDNSEGQLGLGDLLPRGANPVSLPKLIALVDLGPGRTARLLAAGAAFTCALLDDGSVKCWGRNADGQLGQGTTKPTIGGAPGEMGAALPPVDLGGPAGRIAAGGHHVCARLASGGIKCWGDNSEGQLGQGDTKSRGSAPEDMGGNLPELKRPSGTLLGASLGERFGCLLYVAAGAVHCLGSGADGALGTGNLSRQDQVPQQAVELGLVVAAPVSEIAAGGRHACVVAGGVVKCWGRNVEGQLGLGDVNNRGDEAGEMGPALPSVPLP